MTKMLYKPGVAPVDVDHIATGSVVVGAETFTYVVVDDDANVKGWLTKPEMPKAKKKSDD